MGQSPRAEYKELSSFDLQDLLGKKLDFWYGDPYQSYKVVTRWSTWGDDLEGSFTIGYDDNDNVVVELGWSESDCPVRIVE